MCDNIATTGGKRQFQNMVIFPRTSAGPQTRPLHAIRRTEPLTPLSSRPPARNCSDFVLDFPSPRV